MSFTRKPALIAACIALAAGGGGTALLASSAGATVTPGSRAATTGTGTVSITGPKGKTRTRTVPVTCKVVKGREVVRAGQRDLRRGVSMALTVKDYSGAGSYTGTVLITRHSAAAFSGHRYAKVPVTLTTNGGSLTFTKTLSGRRHAALKGKTISVSASWTCSD